MCANPELRSQLLVHRFDHLPQPIPQRDTSVRLRGVRIAPGQGEQCQARQGKWSSIVT